MKTTFHAPEQISTFRKIAAGMWRAPSDPTIYGFTDIDVSETLRVIDEYRLTHGIKLTITHVVAWAVAKAFAKHPALNARIRFGSRVELRDRVDVFVSVATGGGKDLAGTRIDGADTLSLAELAGVLTKQVTATRTDESSTYNKSRSLLGRLPWWATRTVLRLTDIVSNELSLDLPQFGMPTDPFGTAVITNVGTFGIDTAFAPFVPLGRCPLLMLVTEIKDRPWVEDGRLEVRPTVRLCASFDHRIIDGYQAGLLAQEICRAVTSPSLPAMTETHAQLH